MQTRDIIAAGQRVLKVEADAVALLADTLDQSFADAVERMLQVEGRVVVAGIGKSGHVARKIAATLASTGTPAQFVHPSEASHGDMGMVTDKDLVLLLSNSGETAELADLIAHTRRFGITLVGVASRPDSTMMKAADIALVLPKAPEACFVGLAPTTSTTLTLALGDALAVALMEHRHFTPEKFRDFHPGGKLGARLTRVDALMHDTSKLPLVAPTEPMGEVLVEISQKGFGVAGVHGPGGRLVGVITDGDLRRNLTGLLDFTAGDVMNPDPTTVPGDMLAQEALAIMNARKITCLFVTQDAIPIGILHVHDCLRAGVG